MDAILIFRSSDDRDYDKFIKAPAMRFVEVIALADKIVADVKAQGDWQWDDIESALVARGFEAVEWVHCEQEV